MNKHERMSVYMFVVFAFMVGYLYGIWKEADKTYDAKQMEEKYLIKCKQYLELATWFDESIEQLEDCKAKHPKKYY